MSNDPNLADVLRKYPSAHQIEILLDDQGNRAGKKGFANQFAPELLKESSAATREIGNQFVQGSFGGPGRCRIYIPPGTTGFSAGAFDSQGGAGTTLPPFRIYIPEGGLGMEPEDYEIKSTGGADGVSPQQMEALMSGESISPILGGGGYIDVVPPIRFKRYLKKGIWVLVDKLYGYNAKFVCNVNFAYYSQEFPKLALDGFGDPLMNPNSSSGGDPLMTPSSGGTGGDPNDGGNSGGGSTNPDPTPGALPGTVELGTDTNTPLVLSTTIWKRGDPTHITLRPKYSYHTLGALAIEPRGLLHPQSLSSTEASFTVDTSAVENLPVGLTTVKITSAELSCTLRILRITPTPETVLTDDGEGERSQESNPGPIEVRPPPSPSGDSDPVLTIQPLEGLSSFHTLLLSDVTREKWKELYRPEGDGISTEGSFSTLRYRTALNSKMMYKIFVPPGVVSVDTACVTYRDEVSALASAHFSRAPETNSFGPSEITDTDDALSEILSGNTVRFYSPENSGVLVLFKTNRPLTQPSKLGGYIYLHFLQLPGAKVYDMSVRVKVDKAIYEQWYSSMDWSFISEPPTALYTIPA